VSNRTDAELLAELGVEPTSIKNGAYTSREARLIAGFEDISDFYSNNGRLPQHGEDRSIFERLYAVRLDRIRQSDVCRDALTQYDHHQLLSMSEERLTNNADKLGDKELLEALGVESSAAPDITELHHVRSVAEKRAAEEIADRTKCADFEQFAPLFEEIRGDLKNGRRETRRYAKMAGIKQGEFFIINGQMAYVANVGEEFETEYERRDHRLRVIYDNGTESDLLLRSLQRALHRDQNGRRVTDPDVGPLFELDEGATGRVLDDEIAGEESGTIYVLRSKSEDPIIADKRDVLHKIGVTGGDVEKRIANAERDPTYLMAPVEIVATYRLIEINRTALENLLHRFFSDARLELFVPDRFGERIRPREWFLVPLHVIDEVVSHVETGDLHQFEYDLKTASLARRRGGADR